VATMGLPAGTASAQQPDSRQHLAQARTRILPPSSTAPKPSAPGCKVTGSTGGGYVETCPPDNAPGEAGPGAPAAAGQPNGQGGTPIEPGGEELSQKHWIQEGQPDTPPPPNPTPARASSGKGALIGLGIGAGVIGLAAIIAAAAGGGNSGSSSSACPSGSHECHDQGNHCCPDGRTVFCPNSNTCTNLDGSGAECGSGQPRRAC
jgi:hypothetical protein